MDIRILRGHEVSEANQLIKDVFMRQIAPTYVEEGIQTFLSSFNDEHILSLMKEQHLLMLGAFDEKLVGVIGIRDLKDIQSLFVDPTYQGQHVGTKL